MQSLSTKFLKVYQLSRCTQASSTCLRNTTSSCKPQAPLLRAFSTSEQSKHDSEKIDFGFKKVDRDEKQGKVGEVFSSVADSYDVMNDAMSLGVHRVWKNTFVDAIGPLKKRKVLNADYEVIDEVPLKILDVAGGTGDISFRMLEKARRDVPAAGSKSKMRPSHITTLSLTLLCPCRALCRHYRVRHQP